jgi:ribose-phosphate pyrophosphokinase
MNTTLRPAIISGNANPALAKAIVDQLSLSCIDEIKATVNTFPDGETKVQIHDNVRGRQVFVIQPTCSPANQHLMELFIMVDALRRASAREIIAVLPYFGYARQDRKDRSRVPISGKLVANLLTTSGVDRVLAMDLHAAQIQGFFDIPVDHLYATPLFIPDIKSLNLPNLMVLAPDEGGLKRASYYRTYLNCPLGFISKNRTTDDTVEITTMVGEVAGKDVIIVDDLTESAGTIIQAAKISKERGARSVRAYVTHGVLTAKGYDRLAATDVLDELVTTDTTPVQAAPRIRVISSAKLFASAINSISQNESVSALFEA